MKAVLVLGVFCLGAYFASGFDLEKTVRNLKVNTKIVYAEVANAVGELND